MKTAREWSDARVLELYPLHTECPSCGQTLVERYNKRRCLVTLSEPRKVISHFLECRSARCPLHGTVYRPEEEDVLALPGYTFGLDVVTLIGQRRFTHNETLKQIQEVLRQEYNVPICLKEIQLLSEAFLALVTTVARHDTALMAELQALGSIVLSIDGVQPEKGNETLYLLREVRCGRVLAAANLLCSSSEEIGKLLDEVLALGLPIVGIISDHQASIVLAIERKLTGVPHQICQLHYLQQVALPVVNEDRAFKKALKKPIRNIRRIERRVEEKQAQDKITPEEAHVVQDYCLAIRTGLVQEGKYPLDPPGVKLYETMTQISASIDRCLEERASRELKSVKKILAVVVEFQERYHRLKTIFGWIGHIVHQLQGQGSVREAFAKLLCVIESLNGLWGEDAHYAGFLQHALKITKGFGQKLFTYLEQALLPTTNNEMEVFIGRIKKSRRHITGRKATHQFVLREGACVAIFFGLPQPINWLEKFGSVPLDEFRTALANLRRQEYRSKVWLIRRDLKSYLSKLENHWIPSLQPS